MPHEPRLAKKIMDLIVNVINTTPAMSLLYEAISTHKHTNTHTHTHTHTHTSEHHR